MVVRIKWSNGKDVVEENPLDAGTELTEKRESMN